MTDKPAPPRRRRIRWPAILTGLVFALIAVCVIGSFVARQFLVRDTGDRPAVVEQVVTVEQGELVETVQINGALEPRERIRVSFPAGQRVAEVLVDEGDQVAAGAVLARLETRDLQLQVASRQAELDQAQQSLDKLVAGPTEAELAAARARTARARADLVAAAGEIRTIDIELARARLDTAQQNLADLEAGEATDAALSAEQQLRGAEEALTDSRTNLQRTRESASRAKTDAEQALERGVQELERVQRAYSDAFWDWDFVQRTGRHPRDKVPNAVGDLENRRLEQFEIEQFRRVFDDAEVALRNAETALQNLVEAAEQARRDEVRAIEAAERAVATAERNVSDAARAVDRARTRGQAAATLEARQAVAEAERAYRQLVDDPTRPAQLTQLEAALLEAIAAEELLRAGPDAVELAQARTALERARAELARAEADLDAATLRAPIAGTVTSLNLQAGALTAADNGVSIADLTGFLIRGQVTEQSVVRVAVGQEVSVSIDSVPGALFRGAVTRVSELPDKQASGNQGGFPGGPSGPLGGLYPVEILIAAEDERLRVGMATTANIEVLSLPDALIIPLQAVEYGEAGPTVRRVLSGPTDAPPGATPFEVVAVELGESSLDQVQVLSGLNAGDQVILPQLAPPDLAQPFR
jgi:multidrug efflux pump subunit AcrA (membrane-fusion protein)